MTGEALRFHLPVIKKQAGSDRMHPFAPLPSNHLGRRVWSSYPGAGWSAGWLRHANNSGVTVDRWDTSLAVQSWYDGTELIGGLRVGPRFNGFVGFYSGGVAVLGAPWWKTTDLNNVQWSYRWDNHNPRSTQPGEGFFPMDSFTWFDGTYYRLNFLGLNFPAGVAREHLLREYYWTGTGWAWTDHGIPPSRSDDRFNPNDIKMGPNSVLWDSDQKTGWVFVAATVIERSTFVTDQEVFYRYYHPTQAPNWRWESLGRPFANSPQGINQVVEMKPPIALSRQEGNQFKIHVFVVMAISTTRHSMDADQFDARWELWERHHDGTRWYDWVSHGPLPGTSAGRFSQVRNDYFSITSGVVWKDHDTLRINLFGYTSPGGRLIEYFWTGNRWQYGFNIAGPNNEKFRTTSSAVYDHQDFEYITVVGRAENGEIWERFWDSRTQSGWQWRKLY